MISTENMNQPDLVALGLKNKLEKLYTESGIPKKYQFCSLETDWSKEWSPLGKLTGTAKKRSETVSQFISSYIANLENILSGGGLRVKFKDSNQIISDLILDGSKSSGKTLLLSLIGQSAIKVGNTVKFVEWVEYLDRFQSFESRQANEDFYLDCLEVDLLIFDSIYDYNISNNKFFIVQLDRLISTRLNKGKVTICSIDSKNNENPVFGFTWNRFTRETFTFKLPETNIINENKSKRT